MKFNKLYRLFTESKEYSSLTTVVQIDRDERDNWIYTTDKGTQLFLPAEQVGKITLVNDGLAGFVNKGNPIVKFFKTKGNEIVYAANITADVVPVRKRSKLVYLINRKDGRGWAIPGGFLNAGEVPKDAAVREFKEETLATSADIGEIVPLEKVRCEDPREINFFTYPFVIKVRYDAELGFGDDAIGGKWIDMDVASSMKLAFPHHNKILRLAMG